MPETKTFKNPRYMTSWEGPDGKWGRVYISDAEKGHPHYFPISDWDTEVTFTKKPQPSKFKAGDRVDFVTVADGDSDEPGTVVGYEKGKVLVVWDMDAYMGNEYPIHWTLEDDLKLV